MYKLQTKKIIKKKNIKNFRISIVHSNLILHSNGTTFVLLVLNNLSAIINLYPFLLTTVRPSLIIIALMRTFDKFTATYSINNIEGCKVMV